MESIRILQEHDGLKKSQIVADVLSDLPEWFGLPESTQAYIEEARNLLLWYVDRDGEIFGFLTLTSTSVDTAEVHCMGVKKALHRTGLGTLLYTEAENFARDEYKYIQVKTVDEGHYKEYDQTISFYKEMGFSKLEVFPTLWDPWNPCLVMVKALR
ncbi:MAG: GNAT family N-acetyltransferase [Fastidiosipila sp.]|nr:GNAT family N-acetyltransferase [Fastidiosipila sp.]